MRKIKAMIVLTIFFIPILSGISAAQNLHNEDIITQASYTNYRAVLVGIEDYPGSSNDLKTPLDGVNSMYDALKNGDPAYSISTLENTGATRNNIYEKINWLKNRAQDDKDNNEKTVSIFYFAGHGSQKPAQDSDESGEDECIVVYDDSSSDLYYLRDHDLVEKIATIPGDVVVFMESCFCTGFIGDLDNIKGTNKWKSDNIVMFTAHGENQYLIENHVLMRGYHTFCIVSSLTSDTDNDGCVRLGEIETNLFQNFEFLFDGLNEGYDKTSVMYPWALPSSLRNLIIIDNWDNKHPNRIDSDVNKNKKGEVDLSITVSDPDNDDLVFYVFWGDGGYVGKQGPYSSGTQRTLSHTYHASGDYDIFIILKDEHESVAMKIHQNVHIESKVKKHTNLLANILEIINNRFPLQFICSKYA